MHEHHTTPIGSQSTPETTQLSTILTQAQDAHVNGAGALPAQPRSEEDQPAPAFKFLSPGELFSLPPRRMLIDRLLGVAELAMIFGESGIGKTFVVIAMLVSAILGKRFADEFDIFEPLRVCYAAGEGTGALAERFKAAFAAQGITAEQAGNLTIALDVPQLFAPGGNGIIEFVRDYQAARPGPLDLLVIDTLHAATYGANENAAIDAGVILKAIKYAQSQLSCAVLLIHHAAKNGNGERGSSAFRGAMDVILEVATENQKSVLRCSKLKDGLPFAPIAFSLAEKEDSAMVFWEGKSEVSQLKSRQSRQAQIIDWLTDNPTWHQASAIATGIGLESKAIYELLETLCKTGDVQKKGKVKPYNYRLAS